MTVPALPVAAARRSRRSRALHPVAVPTSPPEMSAPAWADEVEPGQAFHDWTPWSSAIAANA